MRLLHLGLVLKLLTLNELGKKAFARWMATLALEMFPWQILIAALHTISIHSLLGIAKAYLLLHAHSTYLNDCRDAFLRPVSFSHLRPLHDLHACGRSPPHGRECSDARNEKRPVCLSHQPESSQ